MPTASSLILERITIDPDVRFGKPCVRGHRITVQEILEWLSGGASQEQILADYPQLKPEDFLAVYAYAAELAARSRASQGWSCSSTRAFRRSSLSCWATFFRHQKVHLEMGFPRWRSQDPGVRLRGRICPSLDRPRFRTLVAGISGAIVVILRSCNYPNGVAAEVLRATRSACRVGRFEGSFDHTRQVAVSVGLCPGIAPILLLQHNHRWASFQIYACAHP